MNIPELLTELQAYGLRLDGFSDKGGRKGGAGPTDHKAVRLGDTTIMVPVHNAASLRSPYSAEEPNLLGVSKLFKNETFVGMIVFPKQPKFYSYTTSDGVPFWKIAQLHSHNVLATTVLQNCVRYGDKSTSCQFCAIGESLKQKRTISYKRPFQLAEVARAAVEFDGIEQFVLTTGTPSTPDRGAKVLCESVRAIKASVDIPIQVQCEPPADFIWFERLKEAGADALGMHLEAVEEDVRQRIMPGKAEVSVSYYMDAFKAAVAVFGRGQVSTYLLAGLGDSEEALISISRELVDIGVYPFVVPFVPVSGTPLENHPAPDHAFMQRVLSEVGSLIAEGEITSTKMKAGCAKCGACSTLKSFEKMAKTMALA
ncbi:MSMEG_0568 family radical SAM protein [Spirosoma aureum]|uniref:MSMEG_0568 family radical SAM protein n=1 Tax=Spirosoma aureum TaxID=2692134 RepID=A0A6G9AWC0_9BACT|nr:MSMEG_0568 family radical SAM protein [Spirosoma aureum]QIP16503.1 MSMEG_0568 family radical SAM protein [Spirosoma aureum]